LVEELEFENVGKNPYRITFRGIKFLLIECKNLRYLDIGRSSTLSNEFIKYFQNFCQKYHYSEPIVKVS
jgi:hypothetical protein